jgi:competence protein ComEA
MIRSIRVAAALLAFGMLPALAQTPAPSARPTPPVAAQAPAKVPVINTAPSAAAAAGKVDINGATAAQLDALPGIGPVRSKAIVAGRPYADLADLVTKKVLTQGVLDGAKARLALANINTSSATDLAKALPGIGDVRSKAIVAGRPYATPEDLVKKNILTQGVFDKVKDVVAY